MHYSCNLVAFKVLSLSLTSGNHIPFKLPGLSGSGLGKFTAIISSNKFSSLSFSLYSIVFTTPTQLSFHYHLFPPIPFSTSISARVEAYFIFCALVFFYFILCLKTILHRSMQSFLVYYVFIQEQSFHLGL